MKLFKRKHIALGIFLLVCLGYFIVFIRFDVNSAETKFEEQSSLNLSAGEITIITPENKTYFDPMSGYYPATYGFEDTPIGSEPLDWTIVHSGGTVQVIEEFENHKKVVELNDNNGTDYASIAQRFDMDKTFGTVEFWVSTNDTSKDLYIRVRASISERAVMIRIYDNFIQCQDSSTWKNIEPISNDVWHHIRAEFDCSTDTYDCWINGILKADDFGFKDGDLSTVRNLQIYTTNPESDYKVYVDAVGYSWDSNYKVGDNFHEGILVSFENTTNLDWIGYSLDNQLNTAINGNKTITMPEEGLHTIQIFGNDTIGTIYQSNMMYFTTDKNHVVSVTGTNKILTDQLMYDDEIKYEINTNHTSTGKSFDGYTFGFNRGSVSTSAATVTPTEGMAVKDDGVIYSTWAVRGGVNGAMTFWQTFTFNLNNLQNPWNESLYLLGFTLHYDILWDAYNLDSLDRYPWSNLYILNNELNQWELIKEEPFKDGSWVDSNSSKFCPKETDPSLFTKKYISNNGRIQFRFKEYSDCSRYYLENAFHTIHWDFLSLEINYLNSECEVGFQFTNGLLDGENDFYLWFQGNTKGSIAQFIVNNESIFPLCMSELTVGQQFPMSVILKDINSIKIKFQTASSIEIDYLFLKPVEIPVMNIEIVSQIFSTEKFNITFFVYNDSGQGIDFATIQMWWNGTGVSSNIQNLGGGIYHVSLDPITTFPGENPILLNMTISADGYEDKKFETYLAVDPETLEKGGNGGDSEPPAIRGYEPFFLLGIAFAVSAFLVRKRRQSKL